MGLGLGLRLRLGLGLGEAGDTVEYEQHAIGQGEHPRQRHLRLEASVVEDEGDEAGLHDGHAGLARLGGHEVGREIDRRDKDRREEAADDDSELWLVLGLGLGLGSADDDSELWRVVVPRWWWWSGRG